jgi:PKD repeat protein
VNFDASGSGGVPTQYDWDYGDGNTGSGVNPIHNYATAGTYNVSLFLTNACGQQDTVVQTVQVCDSLVADITFSFANTTFTFDASGTTGQLDSAYWDFGDGSDTSGINPSHTYTTSGTFAVTLVVTDVCGNTDSTTVNVTVCVKPVANWNFNIIQSGPSGMQVQFDASSSTNAVSFFWDFGDGSTNNTSGFPVHTYSTPGLFYVVTLIVFNPCGDSDTLISSLASIGDEELALGSTELSLYPNPATDVITLNWEGIDRNEQVEFQLLDGAGQLVEMWTWESEGDVFRQEIPIGHLAKGSYFIRAVQNDRTEIRRFVKE